MPKLSSRKITTARIKRVAPRTRMQPQTAGAEMCLGHLVAWDQRGALVDFEGNRQGPLLARVAGATPGAAVRAKASGQEVVLMIDRRRGRPPVLIGFLQPLGQEAADLDARVDGKRIELEGKDEIVLRCGEASVILRRNGRVLIQGVQVETRARGVNRIKGGSVSIN
jgi:hypothetical protein